MILSNYARDREKKEEKMKRKNGTAFKKVARERDRDYDLRVKCSV